MDEKYSRVTDHREYRNNHDSIFRRLSKLRTILKETNEENETKKEDNPS